MCTIYKLKQQYKTREIEDGEQITHYNRKAADVFGIMPSTYNGGTAAAVTLHYISFAAVYTV